VAKYEIIRGIELLAWIYYVLLFIRIIFSWLNIRRPHPVLMKIHGISHAATEPVLRPIRNVVAKYQRGVPIDFSPLIAWLLIDVVVRLLTHVLQRAPL
jgi:YggT family protein